MPGFVEKIKQPSFWVSLLGIVGVVGSALTGSGEPHLIAIGAILTGVYTIVDHVKDAIIESAVIRGTAKVDAAKETYTLPPFFQSDAQHPAIKAQMAAAVAPVMPPAPVPSTPTTPAQGVSPVVIGEQQAQINEVQKQIADLHATLRQAVARANDPAAP